MSKWKCNSCGATYPDTLPDGQLYFHVCSPEIIEHAVCDAAGNVVTPPKSKPRENCRNENLRRGLVHFEGKYQVPVPLKEDPRMMLYEYADSIIMSEGLGRTLVE